MNSIGRIALAAGAVAMAGDAAFGDTIFDSTWPTNTRLGNYQQGGNNNYEVGNSVVLTASAPRDLQEICVQFTFFTYNPATYTPDVQLDVYNVDSSGLPTTLIGTASNNSVTFTGSNYNNGGYSNSTMQYVCFDFSSQGITLPTQFAFAERDNNPAGLVSPGFGFSTEITGGQSDADTVSAGLILASPNSPTNTWSGNNTDTSTLMAATITAVPEPASLGLLSLGALAALRRRRA